MPVEKAILQMVCEYLPSPRKSVQSGKVDKLAYDFKEQTPAYLPAREAVLKSVASGPLIIFVAKM